MDRYLEEQTSEGVRREDMVGGHLQWPLISSHLFEVSHSLCVSVLSYSVLLLLYVTHLVRRTTAGSSKEAEEGEGQLNLHRGY